MDNEHLYDEKCESKRQEASDILRATLKQYGIIGIILLAIKLVASILYAQGVLPL